MPVSMRLILAMEQPRALATCSQVRPRSCRRARISAETRRWRTDAPGFPATKSTVAICHGGTKGDSPDRNLLTRLEPFHRAVHATNLGDGRRVRHLADDDQPGATDRL